MHTVELMEQAIALAERLGYEIRQELLADCSGGACEFGGRKWLFIDLSLNTSEQLGQIVDALREDPRLAAVRVPPALARLLTRRAA